MNHNSKCFKAFCKSAGIDAKQQSTLYVLAADNTTVCWTDDNIRHEANKWEKSWNSCLKQLMKELDNNFQIPMSSRLDCSEVVKRFTEG